MILLSKHKTPVLFDIFGNPMYTTECARISHFDRLCSQAIKLLVYTSCSKYPHFLLRSFVRRGFLSPVSASYFFTGRASDEMFSIMDEFRSFLYSHSDLKDFQIIQLWQKCVKVDVSTSLFPLVEPGSSF